MSNNVDLDRDPKLRRALEAWIAPPLRGIAGQPIDFQYVRFDA